MVCAQPAVDAQAQWQTPNHSVPIGLGASFRGFRSVGPCTSGYFIGGAGASSDPTCQGFLQSGAGAVTRAWQSKSSDYALTPQDFGALANSNGTTGNGNDDTSAIQSAVTKAGVTGAVIYFPCGTYRITSTILGNSSNNIYHFIGQGFCSQIYLDSASNTSAFSFSPAACGSALNPCVIIDGLNFVTPRTATSSGNAAITVNGVSGFTLINSFINAYYEGISIATSYGPMIKNNVFGNIKDTAILNGAADSTFNNGTIVKNFIFGNGLTTNNSAIIIGTSNGGLVIENNNFANNYAGIIFDGTNNGVSFIANYMEGSTSYDLFFNNTSKSWDIQNNRFGSSVTVTWSQVTNSTFANNEFDGLTTVTLSSGPNWVYNNTVIAGSTFTATTTIPALSTATGILSNTGSTINGRTLTGTTNRLTVTNGDGTAGNPTFDISASYIGQSSITTIGTITTGTWTGTKVGLAYGGTNADLSATGGASQVLKQVSSGAAITVAQLAASDLSNGTTGSGAVVLATAPTFVTSIASPIHYGGSAAGSTLILQSTSSGAPSGDSVSIKTHGTGFTWLFDEFGQITLPGIMIFPNNAALWVKDSGAVSRDSFGMTATNVTYLRAGAASRKVVLYDSGYNEIISVTDAGTPPVAFATAASWTANGTVATTMTSLGPTGAHTTIQKWLTIKDNGGNTYYIPAY